MCDSFDLLVQRGVGCRREMAGKSCPFRSAEPKRLATLSRELIPSVPPVREGFLKHKQPLVAKSPNRLADCGHRESERPCELGGSNGAVDLSVRDEKDEQL